jgi:nucleotide-binding universal stress UspA family protein
LRKPIEDGPGARSVVRVLNDPHLLLCYDGSEQATEAIEFAAVLFARGTRATVLYAWELTAIAVSGGFVPAVLPARSGEQDEARALRVAEAGAHRARGLGLDADGRIEVVQASAWRTIVDVADGEIDVIVMGTRGLSGLSSLLLGSCSHHVAQHARCPVLIVPGVELGEQRRRAARADGRAAS